MEEQTRLSEELSQQMVGLQKDIQARASLSQLSKTYEEVIPSLAFNQARLESALSALPNH